MNNRKQNSKNKNIKINSSNKIYETEFIHPDKKNKDQLDHSKTYIEKKQIVLNTVIQISVELGKSKIKIKDFLKCSKGSMLILDKNIKEPLDIFINGHLIASGEIVVSEKKYGIRITNIKHSLENQDFLS